MATINQQRPTMRLLTLAYRAADRQSNVTVVTAGLPPTGVKTHAVDDAILQWLFDAGLKGGINYDARRARQYAGA
jgi:hypothetical protein